MLLSSISGRGIASRETRGKPSSKRGTHLSRHSHTASSRRPGSSHSSSKSTSCEKERCKPHSQGARPLQRRRILPGHVTRPHNGCECFQHGLLGSSNQKIPVWNAAVIEALRIQQCLRPEQSLICSQVKARRHCTHRRSCNCLQ